MTIDETVSLKNIEELVQEREATQALETCPPMREMCDAKPPTQCATICTFLHDPSISRILLIAAEENEDEKLIENTGTSVMKESKRLNLFEHITGRDVKSTNVFNCEVIRRILRV